MLTTFFRPMAALMFASVAGCVLLALRSILLGHGRHLHLVWNLFLAYVMLYGLTHMRFEEETPAFGRLELERAGGTGA
jgi:hypothetical protein